MMLSVLHFVMGDFLHEKVVTQRELNIKAGFPLRTLHFVQKKRIMRLFLHCCVTPDGRIRFGQGQNWQKVRTLIFPATFVFMKGENILEILCEIYPFLDHRYILCPHRPISLYFLHQDNRCQTTPTYSALSGNYFLQKSKRWHRRRCGSLWHICQPICHHAPNGFSCGLKCITASVKQVAMIMDVLFEILHHLW